MSDDSTPSVALAARLRGGERAVLAQLCDEHQERLRAVIRNSLNPRLSGRLDDDDVLQEVYLQAEARIAHFAGQTDAEAVGWLVLVARQTVIDLHRRHLQAQVRDLRREWRVSDKPKGATSLSSSALFGPGGGTTPSQAMARAERQHWLHQQLEQLPENDREILLLRHFVECSNAEAADALGLTPQAASIRYIRALARLREKCGADFSTNLP
jgi:RNA polymerase sigma-70 factor (ECF subfamily)